MHVGHTKSITPSCESIMNCPGFTGDSRSCFCAQSVQAPFTTAGDEQIEKHEGVKDCQLTTVRQWPEILRGMRHEIGDRHEARKQKSGWPSEQADEDQKAAYQLEYAGSSAQREQIEGAR